MMASPVVTFAILSCVFLLTQGRSSVGDKLVRSRSVDFRPPQPDIPALYSAPRSHQEQESQDNEVDQQSSTDRDRTGTTTEIYFDEGTSEDYQFTGTTQNSRDYEPSSSSGGDEKSGGYPSPVKSLTGGYDDSSRQNQQNESRNSNNGQHQRRPLDQQQIENHHYPQQTKNPLTGPDNAREGQNQIPSSFYGTPINSINASSHRQPSDKPTLGGYSSNSQPKAPPSAYPTYPRDLQTQPASNAQDPTLTFQQTRYLPPQYNIQQQQHQQQPQQQQQQYQPQEAVYNSPGISIPPRITIPPRDSSPIPQTHIPQTQNIASFPQHQQQTQQQQHHQPDNNGHQQIYQNYERPQPSLGQYLPPQSVYNPTAQSEPQSNQAHQFPGQRQPHSLISPHPQQQQQQQYQPQGQYLPPSNQQHYQQQQQHQQQQQPSNNFGIEPENNRLGGGGGYTQINSNSAFEIDEPHDDSIVDAELLLRVQRIIEEHERQQKELQERIRKEGERPENFLRNLNLQESNPSQQQQQQQQHNGPYFGGNDNNNNHIQQSNDPFESHYGAPRGQPTQSSPSQSSPITSGHHTGQSLESRDSSSSSPQYSGVSSGFQRFPSQEGNFPFSQSTAGQSQSVGQTQTNHGSGGYEQQVYQDVTNSINNVQTYQDSSHPPTSSHSSPNETENRGRENPDPIQSSNRKTSHIEYQKAILSDHFVETQTEYPSRATTNSQHQEYLPPSPTSSLATSPRENPTVFDARRVGSFNPQFTSPHHPIQSQSHGDGKDPGESTQLHHSPNSNANKYFRPEQQQHTQPQQQPTQETHPSLHSNDFGSRQRETQNYYQSPTQPQQQQQQQSYAGPSPTTSQETQLRSFYGLPYATSEDRAASPQYHQPQSNGAESHSQFNGHNGISSSNYNDIGSQAGQSQNQHSAYQPSSQDQLSQTYNSLASMYPTSFTSNGNSRTIVVHEIPFTSGQQGVSNRALITPADLSQSQHSASPDSNQFHPQNNGFSQQQQQQQQNQDNSYPQSSSYSNSQNDPNVLHGTQNPNPISYHQQFHSSPHSQSHESSGSHNHQFLSSQAGGGGNQADDIGTIVENTGSGRHYASPSPTPYTYTPSSPSSSQYTPNSESVGNQIPISTPQPIYGIPLGPALGLESLIRSSIDNSHEPPRILISAASPIQNHFTQDSQSEPLTSDQHTTTNESTSLTPVQFYPQQQQQQQQQQQRQTFVSSSSQHLPPSQHQQQQQQQAVIVEPSSTNFNHDQLYLNQILSAYNALAAQQVSWNPQQQQQPQQQQLHSAAVEVPSEEDVSHVNNVLTSFSRLPPDTRIVYGPPPPHHADIIALPRNEYFYPRRHRSVRKRLSAKNRNRSPAASKSSSSSSSSPSSSASTVVTVVAAKEETQ